MQKKGKGVAYRAVLCLAVLPVISEMSFFQVPDESGCERSGSPAGKQDTAGRWRKPGRVCPPSGNTICRGDDKGGAFPLPVPFLMVVVQYQKFAISGNEFEPDGNGMTDIVFVSGSL